MDKLRLDPKIAGNSNYQSRNQKVREIKIIKNMTKSAGNCKLTENQKVREIKITKKWSKSAGNCKLTESQKVRKIIFPKIWQKLREIHISKEFLKKCGKLLIDSQKTKNID